MPEINVRVDERHIAWITIDNARKLNTLNSALMLEFAAKVNALAPDKDLRAAVVTGAGEKAFVGGADIDEMAALDATTAEAFITRLHLCCEALRNLPVPVIGRLHGYVLGAGLELAAACDLRITSDTAVFGMPEVKLGIPSVIEAALLPGIVGWGRARQMVLLGETFSSAEAEAWGMVELVVPAAELDHAVERWLASLLAAGPTAIRLQKKLIRQWEALPVKDAIQAGVASFVESWKTNEPRNMMSRFRKKA